MCAVSLPLASPSSVAPSVSAPHIFVLVLAPGSWLLLGTPLKTAGGLALAARVALLARMNSTDHGGPINRSMSRETTQTETALPFYL